MQTGSFVQNSIRVDQSLGKGASIVGKGIYDLVSLHRDELRTGEWGVVGHGGPAGFRGRGAGKPAGNWGETEKEQSAAAGHCTNSGSGELCQKQRMSHMGTIIWV